MKKKIHCRNNSKIHSNNHRNSGKIDTTNRQIHDRSNSSLGTSSSMNSGGANLVLWSHTSPLTEMMWSFKCFPRVSKMSTFAYKIFMKRSTRRYGKKIVYLYLVFITKGSRRIRDRMVVGFTTLWDKACQWLATCQWFSPGTPVFPTNKTDHNDITEILLKVALDTIHQPTNH
jgi:hypothetical protein